MLKPTVLILAFLVSASALPQSVLPNPSKSRILILEQSDLTDSFSLAKATALRAAISKKTGKIVQIYIEGLDLDRFPGEQHKLTQIKWLRDKYFNRLPDLIVTEGPDALDFAIQFRAKLKPIIPIVFTATDQYYVGRMAFPSDITGIAEASSVQDTIKLIKHLFPDTKNITVVGDISTPGNHLVDLLREFYDVDFLGEINSMIGSSMATVLSGVTSLPKDSAIIYLGITGDKSTGQYFESEDVLEEITKRANRPVFIVTDSLMGYGAIGGLITHYQDGTNEAAEMASRILAGESASSIPPVFHDTRRPTFDARQLLRWNIGPEKIPSGADILYYDETLWQRYSKQIISVAAILAIQMLLIFALIAEYRRRRRVELSYRQTMLKLARKNRTTAIGELSLSIGHELNQPLAAISGNAEAAQAFIDAEPPNLHEVRDAIQDIRQENERASRIVSSLVSLYRRDEIKLAPFDINLCIEEVRRHFDWYALSKDVAISVSLLAERSSVVLGDKGQISQVILNLVLNAIEAFSQNDFSRKSIQLGTSDSSVDFVELYVTDNGHGISNELMEHIFEPYYTTKEHGLGMGLSICRSIIEAHGSKLNVGNRAEGGVRFAFALNVVP